MGNPIICKGCLIAYPGKVSEKGGSRDKKDDVEEENLTWSVVG